MRITRRISVLLIVFLAVSPGICIGADRMEEPKIKALYIVNLVRFIEWPKSGKNKPTTPFQVGVVATDIDPVFRKELTKQTYKGRGFKILHFRNASVATACDVILFTNPRQFPIWKSKHPSPTPTLTLGDSERFAKNGGMFGFVKIEKNLRFIINFKEVKDAGLKIQPSLLRLAERVIGIPTRPD
jgi:hypothetical protein